MVRMLGVVALVFLVFWLSSSTQATGSWEAKQMYVCHSQSVSMLAHKSDVTFFVGDWFFQAAIVNIGGAAPIKLGDCRLSGWRSPQFSPEMKPAPWKLECHFEPVFRQVWVYNDGETAFIAVGDHGVAQVRATVNIHRRVRVEATSSCQSP